jgi:serine/threonine protein phosphatase 1
MKIYAISDIHGCLAEFQEALSLVDLSNDDSMLILLGDYVHGPDSFGVLKKVIELQKRYGQDKVIALIGNHEDMVIDGRWPICDAYNEERYDDREAEEDGYIEWMMSLPRYYATERQIFCHAGVEEDAEEMWEWGTDDYTFTEKYPAQIGSFHMDIIAGHIGTAEISNDPNYHDIYFDGESHYYIDGTVLDSGVIPVLMVDTETNKYYRVTEAGNWLILPCDDEN